MINRKHYKGFTIIEVVLVLAIAGLIFLMVFIALPALQRAQRDTQRRNDVAVIAAAVRQYMKNNNGNPPPYSGGVDVQDAFADDDDLRDMEWQAGNDSAALRRYLTDLSASGVTTTVSVDDYYRTNANVYEVRLTIGKEDMEGAVSVFVGARCPADKEGTANGKILDLEVTHLRTDVAIFRYLETGWWYCENM